MKALGSPNWPSPVLRRQNELRAGLAHPVWDLDSSEIRLPRAYCELKPILSNQVFLALASSCLAWILSPGPNLLPSLLHSLDLILVLVSCPDSQLTHCCSLCPNCATVPSYLTFFCLETQTHNAYKQHNLWNAGMPINFVDTRKNNLNWGYNHKAKTYSPVNTLPVSMCSQWVCAQIKWVFLPNAYTFLMHYQLWTSNGTPTPSALHFTRLSKSKMGSAVGVEKQNQPRNLVWHMSAAPLLCGSFRPLTHH